MNSAVAGRLPHPVPAPLSKLAGGSMSRRAVAVLFLCIASLPASIAGGGSPSEDIPTDDGVQKLESRHFVVYTDLSETEASKVMANLERTLRMVAQYWSRRLPGQIECYVVADLERWPRGTLPHPAARVLLRRVGGGTQAHTVREGTRTLKRARIFCRTTPGIAEHEVAHAYCTQVFGNRGPDWYSEGMAQLASFHESGDRAVRCPDMTIDAMREFPRLSLDAVLADRSFTAPLSATFSRLTKSRPSDGTKEHSVSGYGAWREGDDRVVRRAEASYAASWALCHLMSHHARYRKRFRWMGRWILAGQNANFKQVFAGMYPQIGFEFAFFVDRVQPGYRVDLCEWDWDSRTKALEPGDAINMEVRAAHGYQSAGIRVAGGHRYAFQTEGTWQTDSRSDPVTADGMPDGAGRLVGVLFDDFELTHPFDLGACGTFQAIQSGHLFVRCHDDWHALADNRGTVRVRLEALEPGDPYGPD